VALKIFIENYNQLFSRRREAGKNKKPWDKSDNSHSPSAKEYTLL
jgi:hypothetical protein